MVLELRYLRNLKVGTCSVGELENHKEDNNLSSFLNLPPTTLLVNRETPRQYMTFNKFTRDEYVLTFSSPFPPSLTSQLSYLSDLVFSLPIC